MKTLHMRPTPTRSPLSILTGTGKGLFKILGWLISLLMLALALYQYYDNRQLEQKLQQAETKINSAQAELDKARLIIGEMTSELRKYEAKDEASNQEMATFIADWKTHLKRIKNLLETK